MGNIKLKIDCSRLTPLAIAALMRKLSWFVNPILVGGDLIYVEARIHHDNYASLWKILENYNVIVD